MKNAGRWVIGLVMISVVMLWAPSSVYAQVGGDECYGGNLCFCDPDATCCAESGCVTPPPPECQTADECGYGGHLTCPAGQTSNGSCQACNCPSCFEYWTERDDGKWVRRCNRPAYDDPECCDPTAGSCTATPPTQMGVPLSSTPSTATLNWTPGNFGYTQLMRIGEDMEEVFWGCYGNSPLPRTLCPTGLGFAYPTYTPPSQTFSPPIQMFYFKKRGPVAADGTFQNVKSCTGTTSNYATIAACEANLGAYVTDVYGPNTTGICYTSASDCNTYNVRSFTATNLLPGKQYYFRVVNSRDASCYADNYTTYPTCAEAPTALTVTQGASVGVVDVRWNAGDGATAQYIWACTDSGYTTGCVVNGMEMSYNDEYAQVSGLAANTPYYFKVETYTNLNPYCGASIATTSYTTPVNTGAITGTVYLDTDNTCSGSGMSGQTVVLDGITSTTTAGNGAYAFTPYTLGSLHDLAVSIPPGYTCSTAAACSAFPCSLSSVAVSSTKNFYLTTTRGAWWQTEGAGVYAGATSGLSVGSTIPSSATNPYLVLPGAGGGTAAAVVRVSSSVPSLGEGSVNAPNWSARSTYKGRKMNYAFFANQMGVVTGQTNDWASNILDQPAYVASKDFYYLNPASGNGAITNPWVVTSGQKYVVMVDSDLEIYNNIQVQPGGFLAFIVNGNIYAGSGVSQLGGIYLANNDFVSLSNGGTDAQLNVAGSVVAWGNVTLDRDLGNGAGGNITNPAEKFTYSPDLLTNMPDKMKSFVMQWSEVVAGSFE